MGDFKTVHDLAVFLRDEIDKYAGQSLPEEFKIQFKAFCADETYKKKIFKGPDFSPGFKAILRNYRIEMLSDILKENEKNKK